MSFHYKKFFACLLLTFVWNYIAYLNNGLWAYHPLNHMHFSYTLINAMSVTYTVILILISPLWRRMPHRYSWIKTFGIANILWFPTESMGFFMTPERSYLYVPTCLIQNVLSAGINLSYANVLYMNLPEENTTVHVSLYTTGVNVFSFLGLLTGTGLSAMTGDTPSYVCFMWLYSVQYTALMRAVLMRAVLMTTLGIFLAVKRRIFTNEKEIERLKPIRRRL